MHDELIKRLRETSIDFGESDHVSVMMIEAANTIEELQKKYDETQDALITADITKIYLEDVLKYIKTLAENYKAHNRWIPVTERLPEKYTAVVVYSKAKGRGLDFIGSNGNWYKTLNVTHWMPLPEPPKSEGE